MSLLKRCTEKGHFFDHNIIMAVNVDSLSTRRRFL